MCARREMTNLSPLCKRVWQKKKSHLRAAFQASQNPPRIAPLSLCDPRAPVTRPRPLGRRPRPLGVHLAPPPIRPRLAIARAVCARSFPPLPTRRAEACVHDESTRSVWRPKRVIRQPLPRPRPTGERCGLADCVLTRHQHPRPSRKRMRAVRARKAQSLAQPDRRGRRIAESPAGDAKRCASARLLCTHGNPPSNHAATPPNQVVWPLRHAAAQGRIDPPSGGPRASGDGADRVCGARESTRERVAWGADTTHPPSPTPTRSPHPPCVQGLLCVLLRGSTLPPWTRPHPSAILHPMSKVSSVLL